MKTVLEQEQVEVLFCVLLFQYCEEMLSKVADTFLSLADIGCLITLQHQT